MCTNLEERKTAAKPHKSIQKAWCLTEEEISNAVNRIKSTHVQVQSLQWKPKLEFDLYSCCLDFRVFLLIGYYVT